MVRAGDTPVGMTGAADTGSAAAGAEAPESLEASDAALLAENAALERERAALWAERAILLAEQAALRRRLALALEAQRAAGSEPQRRRRRSVRRPTG
jgi:hypothetical protein